VIQPERSTSPTAAIVASSIAGRVNGRKSWLAMRLSAAAQLRATSQTPTMMTPMPASARR
jgi:hypothetical protein